MNSTTEIVATSQINDNDEVTQKEQELAPLIHDHYETPTHHKESIQLPLIKRLKHKFKNDQDELNHEETQIGAETGTPIIDSNESTGDDTSQPKKARTAATPGKPRGATYDGNACMICSDRASGFHYGVLACEGCKGFFKRICKEPNDMQTKRHCVYGGSCEINLRTRNRCQYCRIQKCLALGMSKDGIKLGRRSRKFKENLVQIVSTTTTTTSSSTSNNTSTTTPPNTNTTITANNTNSSQSISNESITHIHETNSNENENKVENNVQKDTHLILNASNSIITLNGDNQLQTIVIPAEQSHLLTNASSLGKQVIAIIQDNKLIFKAIDIQTSNNNNNNNNNSSTQEVSQASCSSSSSSSTTNNDQTPSTSPSKLIQINPNIITNGNSSTLIEIQQQQQQFKIEDVMHQVSSEVDEQQQEQETNNKMTINESQYTMYEIAQLNQINDSVLQAHNDTWLFTKDKCRKFKTIFALKPNINLENLFAKGLLGVLSETSFLEFFNSLIEQTVLFAKIVPYFMEMNETDRITLLKSCVFEIIVIRHSNFFDKLTQKFILPQWESFLSKEMLSLKLPDCKLFIEIIFDFYNDFCAFDLNDSELALFCSYLLFNAGKCTNTLNTLLNTLNENLFLTQNLNKTKDNDLQFNDSEKVSNYKDLFRALLIHEISKRPHKQANQQIQQWINTCALKLKKLNQAHSDILAKYKKSIQFPDLYSELYNL